MLDIPGLKKRQALLYNSIKKCEIYEYSIKKKQPIMPRQPYEKLFFFRLVKFTNKYPVPITDGTIKK